MSSPSMHVCISVCTFFHRLFLYQPLPCWDRPLSLNPSPLFATCYASLSNAQCRSMHAVRTLDSTFS
ncbi:hypothetical protein HDV62DRAFT_353748 [Trichoderma sp. SZMC 28011]